MKYSKLPLSMAAACLSFVMFVSPAGAVSSRSASPKPTLPPGRMRACEARSNAVTSRLTSLIRMTTNMLDVFSSKQQKIEDYYNNVVVPGGKTLPNYSTLLADINAKKAAVTTAWTKAQTDAGGFSCTTGDPKALLLQFRLDLQATKQALKSYRTSIKNLLVAIHRLAPGESPSPTPTATPTP